MRETRTARSSRSRQPIPLAQRRVDLHCHSSASGGAIGGPPMIARQFEAQGYAAFSLTEHDNFESLDAARLAAQEAEIEYIPGVEISVMVDDPDLPNQATHLLAFYCEPTATLRALLQRHQDETIEMRKEFLARLRRKGIADISEDDLRAHIKIRFGSHDTWKRTFSMGPISDLLKQCGALPQDGSKPWRQLFAEICPDLRATLPEVSLACEAVRDAGGTLILAHPRSIPASGSDAERERLHIWLDRYVDGLEVFHETFSAERRRFLMEIVSEKGRPFTGGSDKHSYGPAETRFSDAPYACVESLREFRSTGRCERHQEWL